MRIAGRSGWFPESSFWVRLAFIALILLTPLYYLFVRYGVEAWPTFMMPRFAGGASVPSHYALREVVAVTYEGERVPVRWEHLFGLPGGVARTVAAVNFSPRAQPPELTRVERLFSWLYSYYPFSNFAAPRQSVPHGNDPPTRAWLQLHLAEHYPDMRFERVEFIWYEFTGFIRDTETPSNATAETYVVHLD